MRYLKLVKIIKLNELIKDYKEQWESLLSFDNKSRIFSSSDWLKCVEDTENVNISILAKFNDGRLILGTVIQEKELLNDSGYYDFISHISEENPIMNVDYKYKSIIKDDKDKKRVLFYNPAGTSFDLRFEKSLKKNEILQIIDEIVLFINKNHYDIPVGVLFSKKIPSTIHDKLFCSGYQKVLIGARYSIKTRDIDTYLKAFNKKRRDKIKTEINKQNKYGFTFSIENHDDFIDEFIPMVKNNFAKHGFTSFCEEFYRNRSKAMFKFLGDKIFFIVMRYKGEAVAASYCIFYDGLTYIYHYGAHYEKIRPEWSAYYHCIFYQPIILKDQYTNSKYVNIYTMEGADKIKNSRGCKPQFIYDYIKIPYLKDDGINYIKSLNKHTHSYIDTLVKTV